MVSLDSATLPTLAMLVGAAVFSTTFLTTRVHRERAGRAIDRALKLDELIAEAREEERPLDGDWFDEQREALEATLRDRVGLSCSLMNTALAAATVTLAIAFERKQRLSSERPTPEG